MGGPTGQDEGGKLLLHGLVQKEFLSPICCSLASRRHVSLLVYRFSTSRTCAYRPWPREFFFCLWHGEALAEEWQSQPVPARTGVICVLHAVTRFVIPAKSSCLRQV